MFKQKLFLFILFELLFCLPCAKAYTILIDPGHGGEDQGAITHYFRKGKKRKLIQEKDIVLQLANKIRRHLSKRYEVFLTRSFDRSVELSERADIAEKINADLFISIHANSSVMGKFSGFETYYLSNHQDSAVAKVERIENRDLKGEALDINKILIDLFVEKSVETGKLLATSIHSEIHRLVGRPYGMVNRGIKPGLFYVLALSKRPAVLLEVGFLSNQRELTKLLNPKFQEDYAQAVASGVEKYIQSQKKLNGLLF